MKYKIITLITGLLVLGIMNGCSQRVQNELSEQVSEMIVSGDVSEKAESGYDAENSLPSIVSEKAEGSSGTENSVPSVVSEKLESSEESIYVTDQLFVEGFEGKEFLVYKTHDECYTAGEPFLNAVTSDENNSIKNGEFLLINADGAFYTGGVGGFDHDPIIYQVNSTEKLTMQQVFDKYDYPDLMNTELSLLNEIVRYISGDHVYLILKSNEYLEETYNLFDIYRDSEYIGSYDLLEQENLTEFMENLDKTPGSSVELIEESSYIVDELFVDGFENKEFLVYKTHDKYYVADEYSHSINLSDADSLSLKNGEFLLINADGEFYNGGVAGHIDDPMIHKVNSSEKLTMQQVFETYNYPELADIELSYKNNIVKHTFGNHVYLILKNGSPMATTYDIYMDSELMGSFEKLYEQENLIEFVESLNKSEMS